MRKTLILLPLVLIAASLDVIAQTARIEIILDVSGSMRSSLGSQLKIDAAKNAIRETVSGLQEGNVVALRYYGHRVPQERKDESCKDTELVVQFQPIDKRRFLAALDKAVPRGQTPIAYSLQQGAEDFGAPSDEDRALILVSDGQETCGGDPLATVRDLAAKGFKIKVHTIGFDVDAAARAQLEAISGATGGEYFDARNAASLADTLRQLTQRALVITRESAFGQEIRGGAKYDEAVAIQPGTIYHLDHHQRKDEYDYFAIEARDGQKIVASIQAFDYGVRIRGDKFEETKGAMVQQPFTGIAIHAPDHSNVADQWVYNPGGKAGVSIPLGAGQGGRFYILVGNSAGDQHKNSRFEVTLVDMFDANSGRDAGSEDAGAVVIAPGTHTGYLHANDRTDFYVFNVVPNAHYSVRVKPNAQEKQIDLEVLDRDSVKVKEIEAPNPGAAVRAENVEFPYEGKAFLKVTARQFVAEKVETQYALELTQTGGQTTSIAAAADKAPPAAAAEQKTAAPVQAAPSASGISKMWMGLGVVAVAALVAGAYFLGKRK